MLFYERDGIDMKAYLPKFREPSTSSAESANSDNVAAPATATAIAAAVSSGSTGRAQLAAVNGLAVQSEEQEENRKCRLM